MRLAATAHTSQPWLIHEIAPDFALEDVWALPTPGGPDDFPRLVALFDEFDPAGSPLPVRALFALRTLLGSILRLDKQDDGLGARVPSLRERLPDDLPEQPPIYRGRFAPLYRTDREFAAELANRTVHGVVHLGWVADDGGGYRGQLAILVKPNGRLGAVYMAAIAPFRHTLIYPALIAGLEERWADEFRDRPRS